MKQYQISKAYQVLNRIQNMDMPVRIALHLSMLMKKLSPCFESAVECEKRLVEKYHGEIDENGRVVFRIRGAEDGTATDQDRVEAQTNADGFNREQQELNQTEIELDFQPLEIKLNDVADLKLTMADMTALDGFVNFVEE